MRRKLRSRRGETLVETLVAILIVTLSSVVLMIMLASASRINIAAGEADAGFRAALSAAESRTGDSVATTTNVGGYSYSIAFYGEMADPDAGEPGLRAYALEGVTGP